MAGKGAEQEMTFWDHLEELRGTIFRSILAICLFSVLGFVFKRALFYVVFRPASPDFFIYRFLGWDFQLDLINVEMAAQFFVHLQAAFGAGLIVAFPYVVWELWKFIAPALYQKEKKSVRAAFLMATVLFYMGVAVGYFLVLPACVQFFLNYSVSDQVSNAITIGSYMSMFTSTVLMIGLAFEFPTVIWLLSKIGVLTREQLRKGRRYALVGVLVIAAIVTPADPLSMLIVAAPLYLLYEIAILLCSKSPASPEESGSAA
ncbi:MAG: twin-arginine translocase subunit TatC [Bacteroidales bacterium]|nr:twin-arginine translocase subunit TatC [Bacteroidales bacterium]